MRMKKDQKGYTIVELLIAVAILSIVVASVCGFILVGSRSYASGNSDISVQQEAQLALNQMSDVLIDTTRSVTYTGFDAAGNPMPPALKDAEFASTPENKSLLMVNGVVEGVPSDPSTHTVDPGNGNKHYHFFWSKQDETLYYAELDVQSTDVDTATVTSAFPAFDPTDPNWVELAGHVTDFSVDLSQVEEKRVVQLALTFVDGTKEYVTSNNVTIRNKVAVNDAELDPVNKKKTLSVAARDSGVIIEPGERYHFSTPKVTGENVADRSVKWSLASTVASGTGFIDDENGILQISTSEPAGKITVVITTNAVDSDGNHASCSLQVDIKRATAVHLAKTADTDTRNSATRISPGCTFTISANVDGNKLGQVCSVCSSPDIDIDKQVGNTMNGTVYPWVIVDASSLPDATTHWNPNDYIDIIENAPDHATFYVHPDAVTYWVDGSGKKIPYSAVFQCMSLLSVTDNPESGRHYDWWVPGAITLDFWEENDDAEPYGGNLKYGEQTLDEKIREGLSTDHPKYATAIRVVDNSGKEPDKVLLYFTIGGGANYRICPDLFDLDLNGSYTFYMQAIDPVSAENREKYNRHEVGEVIEDDAAAIRAEYFANLSTNKPYGYVGTKYPHGKVFYAKLDRPKITFCYNGVEYRGKNVTYDPVNIYTVGKGTGVIGEIKPSRLNGESPYENIESNQGMEGMVYSLYEGKGGSQSDWKKWYYFDDSLMEYQGDKKLGGNVVEVNPGGNPFMKLDGDDRLQACGDYHIVPGMLYQNKSYDHYEIIGWDGFDYPNLPREKRYYEFDESTIHVNVNGDFTMEINHDQFRGKVAFPLPKEMASSALFSNIRSKDWQTSSSLLTVLALRDGNQQAEDLTFVYVKYRYIAKENAWEVEPYIEQYSGWEMKIRTHSLGIYKCEENGKKWGFVRSGSASTERALVCNLEGVMIDNVPCKMYFPLPSESGFPFRNGVTKISCNSSHIAFDEAGNEKNNLTWGANVKYERSGSINRITFVNRYNEYQEFGTFECADGAKVWTKVK